MISLFARHRADPLNLVTLPTFAVSHEESGALAAKREEQLRWMRERGMTYLGDPLKRAELRALRKAGAEARLLQAHKSASQPTPHNG